MLERIVVSIITMLLEKLGAFGLSLFKKYLKQKRIDDKVDSQVNKVKKALEEIKSVENESTSKTIYKGRLRKEYEDKLREATRDLTSNLFD